MSRFFVRMILIVAFFVSLGAIGSAFWFLGPIDPSTWATVAASLAVVTSVIASWASQIALELQQDAQKPYPYPSIDVESRYGLVQLRVTNYGGSPAYDVNLKWDKPLINSRGKEIRFTKQENAPEIAVLFSGETISTLIDGSLLLFQKYNDMNYTGFVEYKNSSGKSRRHSFFLSIEKYRGTLTFAKEDPKTQHELQKIPQEIRKLHNEVQRLRMALPRSELEASEEQELQVEEPGENPLAIQEDQYTADDILEKLLKENI
jgi:hypothetical protein